MKNKRTQRKEDNAAKHGGIAERKADELPLEYRERRFRDFFENMLNGFSYCRMIFKNGKPHDFEYLEVNRAFEKLTGLKNVVGKKVSEVIPGLRKSHPELMETFGRVSTTGQSEQFELYIKLLRGWFSLSVYSPEKEYFVAVFDNVTEKRLAEQESRFQSEVIKNIPDAVCAIDLNGIVMSWNRGAETILDYKADEIIGKPVTTVIPEEIAQKELEHCISLLNTEGQFSGYESLRRRKDGKIIPVELTGVAIKDSRDIITNYASIFIDISGRKKAEQEKLKNHMLESVGILAGGIAHDFNNLLTAILGDIGIAKIPLNPDHESYKRLSDAEQVCMIASELSQRLLTFASGGAPVRKTMPISDVVVNTTKNLMQGDDISLTIHLPDNLYHVAIDEGQIRQVVTNLINNAKDAMPNGGAITVRGENLDVSARDNVPMKEGRYLKIAISDTGAGIAPENIVKIFDPYYSTKDMHGKKGLGLGLAVCYSVIKKHDGLITVDSEIGKGTTFTIFLPAAA